MVSEMKGAWFSGRDVLSSSGKQFSGVFCRRELAEGALVQAGCSSLGQLFTIVHAVT